LLLNPFTAYGSVSDGLSVIFIDHDADGIVVAEAISVDMLTASKTDRVRIAAADYLGEAYYLRGLRTRFQAGLTGQ